MCLVSVNGAAYPISAWVGDDIPLPWVRVQMSNFISSADFKPLELYGGEELRIIALGGALGYAESIQLIPPENNSTQVMPNDTLMLAD